MLNRRLLLPIFSVIGVCIALYVAFFLVRTIPNFPPEYPPPVPIYEDFIAGEGIIEASSKDIAIGVPYGEIVEAIFVKEGQRVSKGDPLFRLDTKIQSAELHASRNELLTALAEYTRQLRLPREEEVYPLEEEVSLAKADLEDQKKQLELYNRIKDQRAISQDMLNQKRFAVDKAEANYAFKIRELELLNAGAWKYDLEIGKAKVDVAKAKMAIADVSLQRATITAPIDGEVLRINVRPGQYAGIESQMPLMLFGQTTPLMVRVSIDETEAWRVKEGAKATAYVRGNSTIQFPLKFAYIEPYIVPKQNLTGDAKELVDVRVLQVLFSFEKGKKPIYVGQMVDVYIEADTNGKPARDKKR